MNKSTSKNRGEWSELYVLISLLATGKLEYSLDDESLKSLPIIQISRGSGSNRRTYVIDGDHVVVNRGANRISREWLQTAAETLLLEIRQGTGRAFSIPAMDYLINDLLIDQISADSAKSDIAILLYDIAVGDTIENNFSIKSWLGKDPSLLNASGATKITYRLSQPLHQDAISAINSFGPIKIVEKLDEMGVSLLFETMDPRFAANLKMVDSQMPELLAATVLASFDGGSRDLAEVVSRVSAADPLELGPVASRLMYSHKIGILLQEIGLGMTPSKPWGGGHGAGGGFITVLSDGQLLCTRAQNQESLRARLFATTRFDTPTRKRTGFGRIYSNQNGQFLDLNFQIRFKNIKGW